MSFDRITCPHCQHETHMEGETLSGHVTCWGDGEPKPFDCSGCGRQIWLQEHVMRWWEPGRTPDEASDA